MGKYFSDAVDNALEAIYYSYDRERAAAAVQPLADAANAGDGDAAYILSRCTSGPLYSWDYHPFQADDGVTEQLIRQSIVKGSAMGVLGSMRCGMFTPEMEEAMKAHYPTLKDAWNAVLEKAEAGCLFAMNMIGNTYFWLDIVRIEGKGPEDFPSKEAFGQWLRESELKCVPWFEKAFQGGMGFAGRNLYNLYNDGDDGAFEPDKAKARALARLGAEKGYPDWQERYAALLKEGEDLSQRVIDLYFAAAKQGQLSSWFYVGYAYELGKMGKKDCQRAMKCYELGLQDPDQVGCANRSARLLFLGEDGIPQDYARAVQLFQRAHTLGSNWGSSMLGLCYLFGYGCQKDPQRALQLLQDATGFLDMKNYGLGVIYTQGLGVPENIKKGVEYLQKAPGYAPAQEELLKYKKTFFGKWVRR